MSAYMQWPGIDGEAKGIYYRWIELNSVSWPQSDSSHEIFCQKNQDSTSPKLAQASYNGDTADVQIHFTKGLMPGEMTYLKITLKSAMISGFNRSGSAGTEQVVESFTLNFAETVIENSGGYDPTQTSWSIGGSPTDSVGNLGP